jgi:hypothetical protein
VLFAVLLERAGLIPAAAALVFVSTLAEPVWRPKRAFILTAALVALVYIVFVLILRMSFVVVRF